MDTGFVSDKPMTFDCDLTGCRDLTSLYDIPSQGQTYDLQL